MNKKFGRNQKIEINVTLQELFYLLFIVIMSITKGLGFNDGEFSYKFLFMLAMACVGCKLLLTDNTYLEWLLIIFLFVLVLMMNLHSGEKGPLIIFAIVVGMKNVPLRHIAKVGCVSFSVSMIVKIVYMFFFLGQSGYIQAEKMGIYNCVRWALGYAHPNTVAISYFALVIMIVYCLDLQYNWKHFIVLNFVNLFLYFYCLSYTGMLITATFLICAYIAVHYQFKSKVWFVLFEGLFPACILFSMFIPFVLPSNVAAFIKIHFDSINSRLRLAREFFIPENISAWGVNVATLTDSRYTLDNSYLYCFIFNGTVAFVLLLFGYLHMIHQYCKERRQKELAIILVILVAGIFEPFLFNTSFKNFTLFFLGSSVIELIIYVIESNGDKVLCGKHLELVKDIKIHFEIPDKKWNTISFWGKSELIIMIFGSIIGGIASVLIWTRIPVEKEFFNEKIISKLMDSNELEKALILENLRRIIAIWFGFLMILFGGICSKDRKKENKL